MKKLFIVLSLICVFAIGACSSVAVNAEQTNPIKIWMQNTNGAYHPLCVVDEDTGVNYVVVSTERGNGEYAIAVTPRLNSDGSLYNSN